LERSDKGEAGNIGHKVRYSGMVSEEPCQIEAPKSEYQQTLEDHMVPQKSCDRVESDFLSY